MSGPDTSGSEKTAAEQTRVAEEQAAASKEDKAKMEKLLAPAVSYYTGVSSSPAANLVATAPAVGQITSANKAARENIMATIPAGPARDLALANLERGTASEVATTRSTAATSAIDKLANIGSGMGSMSLSEIGATLSGLQGAGQTQGTIMNAQAQAKAATTGMIGQIAGGAGSMLSGASFLTGGIKPSSPSSFLPQGPIDPATGFAPH